MRPSTLCNTERHDPVTREGQGRKEKHATQQRTLIIQGNATSTDPPWHSLEMRLTDVVIPSVSNIQEQ